MSKTPSTEASRRAFVRHNYTALRRRINELPDPFSLRWSDIMGRPRRWRERWEYFLEGGGPEAAKHSQIIAAVMAAESELSARCVRFIHTDAAVADMSKSRAFLFAAFRACEQVWVLASGSEVEVK